MKKPAPTAPEQAQPYLEAIIEAIAAVAANQPRADLDAAIVAVIHAQAELIARIKNRDDRRAALKACETQLRSLVADIVNQRIIEEGRA